MLKVRRSCDGLIFKMGILIPGKTVFILKRGPGDYQIVIMARMGVGDNDMGTLATELTHCGLVTPYGEITLGQRSFG